MNSSATCCSIANWLFSGRRSALLRLTTAWIGWCSTALRRHGGHCSAIRQRNTDRSSLAARMLWVAFASVAPWLLKWPSNCFQKESQYLWSRCWIAASRRSKAGARGGVSCVIFARDFSAWVVGALATQSHGVVDSHQTENQYDPSRPGDALGSSANGSQADESLRIGSGAILSVLKVAPQGGSGAAPGIQGIQAANLLRPSHFVPGAHAAPLLLARSRQRLGRAGCWRTRCPGSAR